ncbi:hypothetical protein KQI42_19610 [Tissierella sp. MSJ-40]|uniref:YtxH domain-containing protein n=1 Tax=Tissierella simiarum TaxID=2841534 RepID=A0ABS6EB94_9FIRM|nr:hypothetical protein [Tissierella simiarum]MBU5440205.1 hypothetical protein [Tissierella simiarum]
MMNNNGFRNGAFWGSLLGASVGMYFGTKMTPMQRRKMMKSARRATTTLRDGISSFWG